MKKVYLLLVFAPLYSFGQGTDGNNGFDLGVFLLPEINSIQGDYPVGDPYSKPKIGVSGGLHLQYAFNERIALRSGIGYGLKRCTHVVDHLITGSDIEPQKGVVSHSRIETKVLFHELQLPLVVQYTGKKGVFVTLGMEFNRALSDQSERRLYYGNGTIDELNSTPGTKNNLSPLVSGGYQLPLAGKSALLLEMQFKYYLREYLPNSNPDCFHLVNIGVRGTFTFGL